MTPADRSPGITFSNITSRIIVSICTFESACVCTYRLGQSIVVDRRIIERPGSSGYPPVVARLPTVAGDDDWSHCGDAATDSHGVGFRHFIVSTSVRVLAVHTPSTVSPVRPRVVCTHATVRVPTAAASRQVPVVVVIVESTTFRRSTNSVFGEYDPIALLRIRFFSVCAVV